MSFRYLPPSCPPLPPAPRRAWLLTLPVLALLALAGVSPLSPSTASAQQKERILAPELDGAVGYLGSDRPIRLKDLRGKIVLLDFWTLC
jgi:hypothetical protein